MTPDHYAHEAEQTKSDQFHNDLINSFEFVTDLMKFSIGANLLDKYKKALFYGKAMIKKDDYNIESLPMHQLSPHEPIAIDILHMSVGIATEAGELIDAIHTCFNFKNTLDIVNVSEEIGDLLWYISNLCKALGTTIPDEMQRNIDKLRVRFPNKFTEYDANNRKLFDERNILEKPVDNTI